MLNYDFFFLSPLFVFIVFLSIIFVYIYIYIHTLHDILIQCISWPPATPPVPRLSHLNTNVRCQILSIMPVLVNYVFYLKRFV